MRSASSIEADRESRDKDLSLLVDNSFFFLFPDRRLVSQRLIRKLVDSHGSAETRSPSRRDPPATLLM